jgi:hypothetical protein
MNYLPGLASNLEILLISASGVPRITGMSHWCPPTKVSTIKKLFYKNNFISMY